MAYVAVLVWIILVWAIAERWETRQSIKRAREYQRQIEEGERSRD